MKLSQKKLLLSKLDLTQSVARTLKEEMLLEEDKTCEKTKRGNNNGQEKIRDRLER